MTCSAGCCSAQETSLANQLFLSQFVNTAILTIMVNARVDAAKV
jgi:hypothetical protein